MSEPDRDKLAEALFQAARDERPSEAVKTRVLTELLATPPPSSGTGAVAVRRWTTWVGFALVASVGLFAWTRAPVASEVEPRPLEVAGQASGASGDARAPAEGAVTALQAPHPGVSAPPIVTPAPQVEPALEEKPRPVAPARLPAHSPKGDDTDRLAREVRLVDEARRELGASPTAALRVLDLYAREFATGALHREAALVRVEALVKAGRRAEAVRFSQKLVAADPAGPFASRVRELLERDRP